MNINLLMVDDERPVLESIQRILQDEIFHELHVVSTMVSREARDILRTSSIDILLTDIKMPGLSGFELAEAARESNPECRVVFLTGYNDFSYAYTAIKTGCDDFILKINALSEIREALIKQIQCVREIVRKKERQIQREEETQEKRVEETRVVEQVQRYIREHLSEGVSLVNLANYVYMNPAYLSRYFRQETGKTITEFLQEARIEKAKKMLLNPEYKVQEVGMALGIDSSSYFIRIFRKYVGMTPQDYRRKNIKQ